MPIRVKVVEMCDARDDDSSNGAGYKRYRLDNCFTVQATLASRPGRGSALM